MKILLIACCRGAILTDIFSSIAPQTSMSLSSIRNLAYSILNKIGDDIVADKEFTEHGKCEQCGKDIFTINFEAFTVLPCAHVFHRECVEKSFLLNRQNNCPVADCTATVKPVVSDQSHSISSQSSASSLVGRMGNQLRVNSPLIHEETPEQEMVADEIEVMPEEATVRPGKRSNETADTSTNKKSKRSVRPEDSNVLKKLIRELSIGTPKVSEVKERESLYKMSQQPDTSSFLTLYCKIANAEASNETSNQEVVRCYFHFGEALSRRIDFFKDTQELHEAQRSVNDEVREQLPKEVNKNSLWKKTEMARKIYDLFRRIGSDKIQRVRTFTVSGIAKLSWDRIDYVVRQVKKNIA
ncbi:hypothetical protein C1646_720091 [Rhizophagus diaphanus]|nr:hypothetical protein C1646_720091 [Rhizophagus diaphanus] [Rhizophagus sp. MUCL 43196]